jgi:hypothetical protein
LGKVFGELVQVKIVIQCISGGKNAYFSYLCWMKFIQLSILLLFPSIFFANIIDDSTRHEVPKIDWAFHGNIQVNNNGISPVPAFSLGKPSVMITFFLSKGNFTYSPELNYGADGLPWTVNNWLRYRKDFSKFKIGLGTALSMFFGRKEVGTNGSTRTIAELHQYAPVEVFTGYNISEKSSISLTYWKAHGLDFGSVRNGHFVMLSGGFTKIKLSEGLNFDFRPNLFYLNNSIPYEGLFCSAIIGLNHKKNPIHPFTQLVQPIMVRGGADFNWNFGLNYSF